MPGRFGHRSGRYEPPAGRGGGVCGRPTTGAGCTTALGPGHQRRPLAGHLPAPAGRTLCAASKAFLIRSSEALLAAGAPAGVYATAVCPGFTYSEFHDVTGTRDKVSRMPKLLWMDAATVAAEGYAAVMRGQPVHITGGVNRTLARLARWLPPGVVRRVVAASGSRFRATD